MPAAPNRSQRIFIDTAFVVAVVNPRDAHHEQARALAERFRGVPTLTTDAVLLEIGNGLAKEFRAEAVAIITRFLTFGESEVVRMNSEWFERAFRLYQSRSDKQWGLVDCFSFVLMRERGLQRALTFDPHFVQTGFQALMR